MSYRHGHLHSIYNIPVQNLDNPGSSFQLAKISFVHLLEMWLADNQCSERTGVGFEVLNHGIKAGFIGIEVFELCC